MTKKVVLIMSVVGGLAASLIAVEVYEASPGARSHRAIAAVTSGLPDAVRTADTTMARLDGKDTHLVASEESGYSDNCLPYFMNSAADVVPGEPACNSELVARIDSHRFVYSWSEVSCAIEADQGGFGVKTWRQVCDFTSTALLRVDRAEAGTCEELTSPILRVYGPRIDALGLEIGRGHGGSDCVPGPHHEQDAYVVRGARPPELPAGTAWVVVAIDVRISDTDLGCAGGGGLFAPCDEPVTHALMPSKRQLRELVESAD